MPTVRDLRDRIKSLKNTQQITKAMKQVAAAKIRRAEIAQKQARPYADTLSEMLQDLMRAVTTVDHPFMKAGKAGAPSGVVLMSADKGLAGAFNSNVIRAGEQFARERGDVRWYCVGNKARNAVRRLGHSDSPSWRLSAGSKLDTAREVARRVATDFAGGAISEIALVSSRFVSMLSQKPEVRKLVPIVAQDSTAGGKSGRPAAPRESVEFAGSPEFVLSRLLPKYLEFTIFSAMLETDAAFFAAQLLAMTNATDNASKLIDELTISMNNARQAAITKELLEIVAGAEALGVQ
ncbi:MAG: ATP synthase F1 subunit gamma [Candidatus Eremiobacteraeota bacterium]|nr:ATP synthase F1 subunit gamma [Candidatus Eremiobacteraeota bacterium]